MNCFSIHWSLHCLFVHVPQEGILKNKYLIWFLKTLFCLPDTNVWHLTHIKKHFQRRNERFTTL